MGAFKRFVKSKDGVKTPQDILDKRKEQEKKDETIIDVEVIK